MRNILLVFALCVLFTSCKTTERKEIIVGYMYNKVSDINMLTVGILEFSKDSLPDSNKVQGGQQYVKLHGSLVLPYVSEKISNIEVIKKGKGLTVEVTSKRNPKPNNILGQIIIDDVGTRNFYVKKINTSEIDE